MNALKNYNELNPESRAAIAFEAHTLEDSETVQLIEASFKDQNSDWCLYADRLTNLNLLMLSLTGVYWKLAATHDFRSAWATQEVIKAVCEQAELNITLIFECNDIEPLPSPIQYDADWLHELKQTFIARL
ncbi:MAG: hypothetical protein LUO95_04920 [Methylococcaceae bacterium]|nr:hypothetical protein [Methylococcaceae bacterium]MDD1609948.1 hypothetical protein [Methylococcaceae bacterium]MDD1616376.1 hypothetical protein [Methylococcaceae bacterium]OYV17898.1 MAG: hypothetical protein CG439_1499 [Methylococcaceae bacterium NSP1-2]